MTSSFQCIRCRREDGALEQAPIPGPAGAEIATKICASCWAEWLQMEVVVINELRLNFMEPRAQEILDAQMREFLGLGESG